MFDDLLKYFSFEVVLRSGGEENKARLIRSRWG